MYRPGPDNSWRRASPLTRLAVLAVVAAMLPLWPAPVLLGALCLALAGAAGLGFGRVLGLRLLVLMAPVGLALGLVHGFLIARGPPGICGPVACYPEGLRYALLVFSRLALLLSVSLIFVMTTRPSDLARALDGAGVRPSVSYLLTAPLSLVESVGQEARQIRDSLQMRGLSARGPLRERFRMLVGMVNPLVRGLITEAPVRAEALEMRGFRASPKRGLIDPVEDTAREIWLRRGLLAIALLQLGLLLLWR